MYYGRGNIQCEGCSKTLDVVSDYSAMRVCPTCGNVNMKHNTGVSFAVGRIPEDLSVIKIGSKGKCHEGEFEVIGRSRIEIGTGYYNLWSIVIKNTEELAWLIDSMGEYIIASQKKYEANSIVDRQLWQSAVDKYYTMPVLGSCRLITNKKIAFGYLEGEVGNLPLYFSSARVYDLRADDDVVVFIIKTDDKNLFYLKGVTYTWQKLALTNTRNIQIVGKQ